MYFTISEAQHDLFMKVIINETERTLISQVLKKNPRTCNFLNIQLTFAFVKKTGIVCSWIWVSRFMFYMGSTIFPCSLKD